MRSNEERVAAVKRRVEQIEGQKRQRRNRLLALSPTVVCLAVIVGVSFAMPGISEKLAAGNYTEYETAASIFGGSAAARIYYHRAFSFCPGRMRNCPVF